MNVTAPSSSESLGFKLGGYGGLIEQRVISLFGVGGRDVADCFEVAVTNAAAAPPDGMLFRAFSQFFFSSSRRLGDNNGPVDS
jgi:hypothetical protein